LDAVDEVGLLVVVGCEDDEVDDALEDLHLLVKAKFTGFYTYSFELGGVFLDCLCV
jgi:hypothetical protein